MAVVATAVVFVIRAEIVHLSRETYPAQMSLEKRQRGFVRIGGAFARISAAASLDELATIESELAATTGEVQSIAGSRAEIESIQRTGEQLRAIARERIESRARITDANRIVTSEVETVTAAAGRLSQAMAQLHADSQGVLVASRKTSLEASSSIKALLVEREKTAQLRSCLYEARLVQQKFRLNVLRDKVDGILEVMASQELPQGALATQLKLSSSRFAVLFDGESGLLAARAALLAAPKDEQVLARYEDRQKTLTGMTDDLSRGIAEAIDPLELAVQQANIGMERATERIGLVAAVSAQAEQLNTQARSMQALTGQLLDAQDMTALERISSEIARQNEAVNYGLAGIRKGLSLLGQSEYEDAVNHAGQSFARVRELLIGSSGVKAVVASGIDKQRRADQLFAAALTSIRAVARESSRRARVAEEVEEAAVARAGRLSAGTALLVGLAALSALLVGSVVGRRVRGRILASEERQIQLQEKLREQALHDVLTGLPNRLLFGDELARKIADKRELAVLCVDLDRFKQVNDTLGHRIGDLYLVEIARRMQEEIKGEGVVARMGGDEFNILLPHVQSREEAEAAAQSILLALSRPVLIENCPLQAGGSIGIARFPEDGLDSETLLKNADQAMYRAKNSGRNQFAFFDSHLAESIREATGIQELLRTAIQNGEFRIEYQPQFTTDGRIGGLEALLRFRHPTFGTIPPCRFIPIAEESGLILPIGDWVLREVVRQSLEWQRKGFDPIRISVNVSALQFAQADFFSSIQAILRQSGLAPNLLDLELTKTVVMSNLDHARQQMEKLRSLGVHISIDDFGTGYSSLNYLHKLPVDTIKIDQSFTRDLDSSTSTLPLVQAIVSAAQAFGLTVVAEGVETESQRRAMTAIGCDYMQGYLFARPLSVEAVEDTLGYSSRSGSIGSMRAARRAGMEHAAAQVKARTPSTLVHVSPSCTLVP